MVLTNIFLILMIDGIFVERLNLTPVLLEGLPPACSGLTELWVQRKSDKMSGCAILIQGTAACKCSGRLAHRGFSYPIGWKGPLRPREAQHLLVLQASKFV